MSPVPPALPPSSVAARVVCVCGATPEDAARAAAAALESGTFSVLAFFWSRRMQRALDAAWRAADAAPVEALPAEFAGVCAPAMELLRSQLARRASKHPAPRFVCLDLDSSLPPERANPQRLRRLQTAMLSGERALVVAGHADEAAAFAALAQAQFGPGAVDLQSA